MPAKKSESTSTKGDRALDVWPDFLDNLQLRHIRLEELEALQKIDLISEGLRVGIDLDASYEQDDDDLIVRFSATVVGKHGRKHAVKIRCAYLVEYTSPIQVDPALFELFKQRTLVLNLWPFVRETVHFLTGRMSLRPLTLPLVKALDG